MHIMLSRVNNKDIMNTVDYIAFAEIQENLPLVLILSPAEPEVSSSSHYIYPVKFSQQTVEHMIQSQYTSLYRIIMSLVTV